MSARIALPVVALALVTLAACSADSDGGSDPGRADTGNNEGECSLCIPGAEVCREGRCQPASCTGDECPIGFECLAGACRPEEGCGTDLDCDGGRCIEGDCYTFECEDDETRPCETACGAGVETCAAGVFGRCDAPRPVAEYCGDGVDQDCDGEIDEGCDECDPTTAVPEVCFDGVDNDCDGEVDEGDCPDCQEGDREECSTECGTGFRACEDGELGACSAAVPADEVCDGEDNDCDGEVDEALTRGCETACGLGDEVCDAGAWGECDAPTTCDCDNGDRDIQDCGLCGERVRTCVGSEWGEWSACTGEGVCEPGTTEEDICGESDRGICALGVTTRVCGPSCEFGSWSACAGDIGPITEVCGDGVDQDCNGSDLVVEDEFENNDTCATAHFVGVEPLGEVISAMMSSEDDSDDYFSFNAIDDFNVTGSEQIVVSLESIPAGADYDLYLYRSLEDCEADSEIAYSTGFGSADEEIVWVEPRGEDGGIWYVRVNRFSGASCETPYRLEISGLHLP